MGIGINPEIYCEDLQLRYFTFSFREYSNVRQFSKYAENNFLPVDNKTKIMSAMPE